MPEIPAVGSPAPAFSLPASTGGEVALKSLRGKAVVLYFYPKDDTPGCTVEACGFGTEHARIVQAGAVVLGVSPDPLESHARFIKKFDLPFTLLSDQEHACAEAYGVWVKKSFYGKESMGVQRATFLIDAAGVLRRVWPKVQPEGHPLEVLEAVKALGKP